MKNKKYDPAKAKAEAEAEEQANKAVKEMVQLIKNTAHQIATYHEDSSFSASEVEGLLNAKRPENDQLPENEVEFFISEMIDWAGELVYNPKTRRYKVELNSDTWEMLNEAAQLQTAIYQTAANRFQNLTTEETWHMAIALQKNLILKRQKNAE